MELSPARQKLLFVVIVLVLVVVGYVIVVPALGKHNNAAPSKPSATPSTPSTDTTPNTAAPVATTVPAGNVNIYDWLPFTQQGLADAAALATQFAKEYDTFTYTESATTYTDAMGNLITAQLAATLQNAFETPGVASLRTSQKQTSTATASIMSLRGFGSSSLTFIVNIAQKLATATNTTSSNTLYAVTLTGSGANAGGNAGTSTDTGWQVSDIEFANQGNS
jgi:hypothetical protein